MNQSVTPPGPCSLSGLTTAETKVEHSANHHDFLSLLDDKLRLQNERLIGKLLAWGELLDEAGWCVGLRWSQDDFWLSERATRELQQVGDLPTTWDGLLSKLAGVAADSVHRKGEGVIFWSAHPFAKDKPNMSVNLTRRETEVMSWLCEGKTSQEIAIISGCSTRTVEKHLANLYRKLGVKSRAEVILKSSNTVN